MKKETTLYKYDENDRLRVWTIFLENNSVYTKYGLNNGKKTSSTPQIFTDSKLKTGEELAKTFYNKTIKLKLLKGFKKSKNKNKSLVILPMRAHKYEDHFHKINYPAYVQIKYDGFRCLAHYSNSLNKVVLTSNNGKIFYNLEVIENQLKPLLKNNQDLYLDGELYIHDSKLQVISSLLLSKKEVDTSNIVFNVFDCFFIDNLEKIFKQRYNFLRSNLKEKSRINLVKCFKVENKDSIDKYFHSFLGEGYEGIIIRNYDGLYKLNGKSYDVLRSKEFRTEYFKIVGAKRGSGSQENSVIWILQCMINTKKTFNAIPYGTIEERKSWLKNYKKYLNKIVEVKYITKDNDGCVTRNPIVIMK